MRAEPAPRLGFALAEPADDAALRACMAEVWMEGDVALGFRREPSYFAGCRLQGDRVQVIKCSDRASGRVVGIASRASARRYVDGRAERIGFLADLRLRRDERRGTVIGRGYRFLRALHEADPLPFYASVIFDGNEAALGSLLDGRAGLPTYRPHGRILTPALHLDFARPALAIEGVRLARASAARMAQLQGFLRREASHTQLSPIYAEADFAAGGPLADLVPDDFFVAFDAADDVIACLAAWDQSALRQTHIERYSPGLARLRPLYNAAAALSPLKPLPAAGGRLKFVYLCCVAVRANDVALFRALLRFATNELRHGPWHHAIPSLHEGDPLAAALTDHRRIAAAGRLFLVHYPDHGAPPPSLDARPIRLEMALT